MTKNIIENLEFEARRVRRDLTTMLYISGSGHWGGSLGMADVFTVLFFGGVLKYNSKKADLKERDRFILSNGHIAPVYYTCLEHAGFFGDKKAQLRKIGSPLQGHPSHLHLQAVETSTGPLGQGVGVAVGKAIALKMKKINSRVFCITSDGEYQEGSTIEAIRSAAKYCLDNLVFVLDRNHLQISGTTEEVSHLGNIALQYRDLGWEVFEVNGHDIPKLLKVFNSINSKNKKPKLVIAKTTMGKGVRFIENDHHYHGKVPSGSEYEKAMEILS
mgnify:CR=1 FL=1|uniref:Transketolase n=1 Tax=candidate division CPR3 bacterium TaxID=2268181 RepID=A0A7C4R6P6_UNCC3